MQSLVKNFLVVAAVLVWGGYPSRQEVATSQPEKELPAKSYKGTFGRVSNYLMYRVPNNDPQANLASVIERLDSGKADDLEKVVLRKIIGVAGISDKCDQTSYAVLMDSDQITEGGQHGLSFRRKPAKRIDQLFNFYCTQHAIRCQRTIMDNFKDRYQMMDEDVKHRVATWMDAVNELHSSELKPHERTGDRIEQLFNDIIRTKGHIRAVSNVKPAYDAIVKLSEGNFKQNKLPDGTEIVSLFKELLLASCNKFVEQLGPGVFERANFDLSFHHSFKHDEQDFYLAWSGYQLCTSLKLKFDWMFTFLNPNGMLAAYATSEAEKSN